MPNLLFGRHKKTRRLFGTKWTQSFKISPGALEMNILSNHVLNRQPCPDILFCFSLHTPYYITSVHTMMFVFK